MSIGVRGRDLREMGSARHWRRLIHSILDGQSKHSFVHQAVDIFLIVLILVNVSAIVVETLPGWPQRHGAIFQTIEIVSVLVFTIEYVLRIWSAIDDPTGRFRHPVGGRLRYAMTPMALIDLAAILPFYLSMLIGLDLRWLRLMRLLRLVKITRYSAAFATLAAVVAAERRTLVSAFLVMGILVLMAAFAMYNLEAEAQPEVFASIPHALWWAVVTLSTVGYGDVGIFALPTAILTAGFARELQQRDFVISVSRVSSVPVLSNLDPVTLAEIASLLVPISFPARHAVFRRGERPDGIYFIVDGEVEVDLGDQRPRLGPGQFFGERGVLAAAPEHAATVMTLSEAKMLRLPADAFYDLAEGVPELTQAMQETARERAGMVMI